MSDSDQETFEQGDAGSSHTYPQQAGTLKVGAYAMLKGHPCKIKSIATSKAGKHGHAKAVIVGTDIFTDKNYEDMCPSSHNMYVPNVERLELLLTDVGDDGYLSLMKEDGEIKEDLKVEDPILLQEMKDGIQDGKNLMVSVICALGQEKVTTYRVDTS